MSLITNGAGATAADPILKNLGLEWVISSSTMDVATLNGAWIDTASGIPGTNSVLASLSPASTVLTSGNNATYNDTTKNLTVGSTTGLAVGDYLYIFHASITAGVYAIASIVDASNVTLVANPFNGLGNKTGVAFQVAWRYSTVAGTAPLVSSAGGQINYFKSRALDSLSNAGTLEDSSYIRDAPAGSAFISIGGQSYTGGALNTTTAAFNLLSAWANRGGVSHVELTSHSVQAVNNFRWGDASITEKTTAAAIASGFSFVGGDGVKYGRLLLKSKTASAVTYGIDMSITLDTTGPVLVMNLFGR